MRKLFVGLLLALAWLPAAGCSMESAEARMRRMALKRVPSDEEEPVVAVVPLAGAGNSGPLPPASGSNASLTSSSPSTETAAAPMPAAPMAAPSLDPNASSSPPTPPSPPIAAMPPAPQQVAVADPAPGLTKKTATPVHKPTQPLTLPERRARSIENLQRIGMALLGYAKRTGSLPSLAGLDAAETRQLSWRVAILPELGYGELYQQFHHDEPWDSQHNAKLLPFIPAEYASPERFDERTNYQAIGGAGRPFQERQPTPLVNIKDGLENTILVVEFDDSGAMPWTRPMDCGILPDEPRSGISQLRPDGAFALLGSGRVVGLTPRLSDADLLALFTIAGGEPITAVASLQTPAAEDAKVVTTPTPADAPARNALRPADMPPMTWAGTDQPVPAMPAIVAGVALPGEPPPESAIDSGTIPVPAEKDLDAARQLLREVYGERHARARTWADRQKLAQFLLSEVVKTDGIPAHYYEALRITRDMAAACGDATTALEADKLLAEEFRVDGTALRINTLEDLAKSTRQPESAEVLITESRNALQTAVQADRYDLAVRAYEVLLAANRVKGDRIELNRLVKLRPGLHVAKDAFTEAAAAVQALKANTSNAAANESVGKYLCFVKNQWEIGLPFLTRSADIKVRVLATIDLETTRSPQETLTLADQYRELAADYKQPHVRGLDLRAAVHYHAAIAQLPAGLEKVKAEQRLKELRGLYGDAEIDRVLIPTQPMTTVGLDR